MLPPPHLPQRAGAPPTEFAKIVLTFLDINETVEVK
jgi:hypothetical protein